MSKRDINNERTSTSSAYHKADTDIKLQFIYYDENIWMIISY